MFGSWPTSTTAVVDEERLRRDDAHRLLCAGGHRDFLTVRVQAVRVETRVRARERGDGGRRQRAREVVPRAKSIEARGQRA